ncbi:MAG: flagellar hook-length control protein FliK, partial [Gammaproteobacteria bacterium]|nr:flagellar hook-length control protein FliK [Gammaproteobacteria bacterium]
IGDGELFEEQSKDNEKLSLAAFWAQLNLASQTSTQSSGTLNNVSSVNYSEILKNQINNGFSEQKNNPGNQPGNSFDGQKQFIDQEKLLSSMNENKKVDADAASFKLANVDNKVAPADSANKSLSIKSPVASKNWNTDFNNHIALMAKNGGGNARIKLNPAHLGPVEASIKISNEVAIVNITASQAQTRDALDAGILRLKEMLQEQGFSQVDVNVSQDESAHSSQESDTKKGSGMKNASLEGEEKGDVSDIDDKAIEEPSVINGVVDLHV